MGRKPTVNLHLPSRLRARRQKSGRLFFYYDTGEKPRREIPLGSDRLTAIKRWAELEGKTSVTTLPEAVQAYVSRELPSKATTTDIYIRSRGTKVEPNK